MSTPEPVVVRPALRADLPSILALERASGEVAHWSEAQYAAMLTPCSEALARVLLVAERDGGLAGFLAGSHVHGEKTAELESVLVSPAARRQQVARKLYGEFALWVSRERSGQAITLEVRASNAGAIVFYEQLGFDAMGRRGKYYSDPEEDAVLMRHVLLRATDP